MDFALIAFIESDVTSEASENTDKENRNVPAYVLLNTTYIETFVYFV
jgi:hypothetical protein